MGRLRDKVAIVTGGATGIGEAISHKFASEGARVIVNGLPGDPVDDVVARITAAGGQAVGFVADLSDEANAEACVNAAVQHFGKLDILINNAGSFPAAAEVQDFPLSAFESLIKNNVRSAFLMTQKAIPHLQTSRGNVICAGSEAGWMGEPMAAAYGGTKGFLHAFMKGVAAEQAKHGVRANCVCPGPIDTSWTHKEIGPMNAKMEKATLEGILMGRRGTPEEVANVYAFLASGEATYVTAALYFVDGGTTSAKGPVGSKVPRHLKKEPEPTLPLEHARDGRPWEEGPGRSAHERNVDSRRAATGDPMRDRAI